MARRGFEKEGLLSGSGRLLARVAPDPIIGVDPAAQGRVRTLGTLPLGVSGSFGTLPLGVSWSVGPWLLRHIAH